MSTSSNKLVEVGVVLQGGGALGAYECGALNALLELMDEFAEHGRRIALKVVTGVSIGVRWIQYLGGELRRQYGYQTTGQRRYLRRHLHV